MKIETVIVAVNDGTAESVYVKEGHQVQTGELLARMK